MNDSTIIVSMTTWPPRAKSSVDAMKSIVRQRDGEDVHFVLVLSREEWSGDSQHSPKELLDAMSAMGVEVIWDDGNTRSHKKLMPTLGKYPGNAILVVDDDRLYHEGWLHTFIEDHRRHPHDIIYGSSSSVVEFIDGKITEGLAQRGIFTRPGEVTYNEKPANGASGTLYPSGTFTDPRFFDRSLYMRLSPTSDETWQWAWSVMAGRRYRCLSDHNNPTILPTCQDCALFKTNMFRYTDYHNAIAAEFPVYKKKLIRIIQKKELCKQRKSTSTERPTRLPSA